MKKSIDLSRVWTREPRISRRVRYPETTEVDNNSSSSSRIIISNSSSNSSSSSSNIISVILIMNNLSADGNNFLQQYSYLCELNNRLSEAMNVSCNALI